MCIIESLDVEHNIGLPNFCMVTWIPFCENADINAMSHQFCPTLYNYIYIQDDLGTPFGRFISFHIGLLNH